jgi:hypothetical protein
MVNDFSNFHLETLVEILKEYTAARTKMHGGSYSAERLTQLSEQIARVRAAIKLRGF